MCESKIWKIIIFHNLLRNKWNFLYDINRSYLVQDPWVKGHNEDIENDPKENRYGTLNTKSTSDKEYSHKRYSVKKRQVSFVFSHRILWLWNLLIKAETCLISLNQYNNWPRHLPSVHVNRFFFTYQCIVNIRYTGVKDVISNGYQTMMRWMFTYNTIPKQAIWNKMNHFQYIFMQNSITENSKLPYSTVSTFIS